METNNTARLTLILRCARFVLNTTTLQPTQAYSRQIRKSLYLFDGSGLSELELGGVGCLNAFVTRRSEFLNQIFPRLAFQLGFICAPLTRPDFRQTVVLGGGR